MPRIIVTADDSDQRVLHSERVTTADFETDHFRAQLAERVAWRLKMPLAGRLLRRLGRRRTAKQRRPHQLTLCEPAFAVLSGLVGLRAVLDRKRFDVLVHGCLLLAQVPRGRARQTPV